MLNRAGYPRQVTICIPNHAKQGPQLLGNINGVHNESVCKRCAKNWQHIQILLGYSKLRRWLATALLVVFALLRWGAKLRFCVSLLFLVFVSATLSASLRATHREWRTCAARKHQDSLFRPSCFTHVCPCFVSCVPPAPIVCSNFHKHVRLCTQVRSALLLSVKEPLAARYKEAYPRHRDHMQTWKIGLCPDCCQEVHSLHFRR